MPRIGLQNSLVVLFDKFQENEENLIFSLMASVPHLTDVELNQLKKAIETEKMTVIEELLKREFPIDSLFNLVCKRGIESVITHMLDQDKELLEA